MTDVDAFTPAQVAERVERLGVAKARAPLPTLVLLSLLAGAFIGLGALLFTVVTTGSTLGFGPTRLLGGVAFSLGLLLVVVAGAELFTGNNLVAMAWASKRIGGRELLRSWLVVYAGNLAGALGTMVACYVGGAHRIGAVAETLIAVGAHKTALPLSSMFVLGVLCNALVCLAVWLTQAGRSVADKAVGVVFPVTAFVALGFEHSIANMFLLPYAALLDGARVPVAALVMNIAVVTAGNVVGGTLLVAGIYWLAYLRGAPR